MHPDPVIATRFIKVVVCDSEMLPVVRLTALLMLCTGVSSTCMLPAPPLDMRGSLLSGPIVSSSSGQWSLQMRRHKVGQFEHIPLHVLICHRAQHLDL